MTTPAAPEPLRPCPFSDCLGAAPVLEEVEHLGYKMHRVRAACGAAGPIRSRPQDAAAAWNRRPAPEPTLGVRPLSEVVFTVINAWRKAFRNQVLATSVGDALTAALSAVEADHAATVGRLREELAAMTTREQEAWDEIHVQSARNQRLVEDLDKGTSNRVRMVVKQRDEHLAERDEARATVDRLSSELHFSVRNHGQKDERCPICAGDKPGTGR